LKRRQNLKSESEGHIITESSGGRKTSSLFYSCSGMSPLSYQEYEKKKNSLVLFPFYSILPSFVLESEQTKCNTERMRRETRSFFI